MSSFGNKSGSIVTAVLVVTGCFAAAMFWLDHSGLTGGWLDVAVVSSIVLYTASIFGALHFGSPRYRYRYLKGTGLRGTARAMSWPATDGDAANVIGSATLRVSLPGQEAYLVKMTLRINERQRAAFTSQALPVWVDPEDRERVFIDWEQVPTADEMVRQRHEEMLRAERGNKGSNKGDWG